MNIKNSICAIELKRVYYNVGTMFFFSS